MSKTFVNVIMSVIPALALTIIFRNGFAYEGIDTDLSAWGVFFSVFGVIYAIIAGFLLVEVLQRFASLSATLEEELNALQDIRDFLTYLDNQDATKKGIIKSLAGYVDKVSGDEWEEMQDLSKPTDSDTSMELTDLINSVAKVRVGNDSDQVALQLLVEKISNITTLRTKRINVADAQLPPRLKILLLFMSVFLIVGFILMHVANVYIHLLIVAGVTIAIVLNYLIIDDLNTPFDGVWSIGKGHFLDFHKKLSKTL